VALRLAGGALEKGTETELPWDFIPLFSAPGRDGRFLVSGVAPGALEGKLDASLDSAARVLGFLKESVQLGKILSVGRVARAAPTWAASCPWQGAHCPSSPWRCRAVASASSRRTITRSA
jgi:hypothetical protein